MNARPLLKPARCRGMLTARPSGKFWRPIATARFLRSAQLRIESKNELIEKGLFTPWVIQPSCLTLRSQTLRMARSQHWRNRHQRQGPLPVSNSQNSAPGILWIVTAITSSTVLFQLCWAELSLVLAHIGSVLFASMGILEGEQRILNLRE